MRKLTRAQKRQITKNLFSNNHLRFLRRHIENKEIHLQKLSKRKGVTQEKLLRIANDKEARLRDWERIQNDFRCDINFKIEENLEDEEFFELLRALHFEVDYYIIESDRLLDGYIEEEDEEQQVRELQVELEIGPENRQEDLEKN